MREWFRQLMLNLAHRLALRFYHGRRVEFTQNGGQVAFAGHITGIRVNPATGLEATIITDQQSSSPMPQVKFVPTHLLKQSRTDPRGFTRNLED